MKKIPSFHLPLWLACERKDETLRPFLCCVHFKEGYAYASDAHVCVKVSMKNFPAVKNRELLDGKMIHWKVFKALMAEEFLTVEEDRIVGDQLTYAVVSGDGAPAFDALMPSDYAKREPLDFIGLRPELLATAAKCMGCAQVGLRFIGGDKRPIVVVPDDPAVDARAIVMPYVVADYGSAATDPMLD